jgi:hypothetical protein
MKIFSLYRFWNRYIFYFGGLILIIIIRSVLFRTPPASVWIFDFMTIHTVPGISQPPTEEDLPVPMIPM